jgi:hypothetical protein
MSVTNPTSARSGNLHAASGCPPSAEFAAGYQQRLVEEAGELFRTAARHAELAAVIRRAVEGLPESLWKQQARDTAETHETAARNWNWRGWQKLGR